MPSMLRYGNQGPEVVALQAQLSLDADIDSLALDGIFGPLTMAATKSFQQRQSLAVDGIVGPMTWGALAKLRGDSSSAEPITLCGNGLRQPTAHLNLFGHAFKEKTAFGAPFGQVGAPAGVSASVTIAGVTVTPLIGSKHETAARTAYGSSLHYDRIFFSDSKGLEGRAFTAPFLVPPLVVDSLPFGGTVQVLNVGKTPSHGTLVHELGHAWQSQHASNAAAYTANCVACQGAALAANKLIGEKIDSSVKSHSRWPVNFPMSAYAYRPGKTFGDYGGEQIAEQIENGEAPIVSRVRGAGAGSVDSQNDDSVSITNIRMEDRRAKGVKI